MRGRVSLAPQLPPRHPGRLSSWSRAVWKRKRLCFLAIASPHNQPVRVQPGSGAQPPPLSPSSLLGSLPLPPHPPSRHVDGGGELSPRLGIYLRLVSALVQALAARDPLPDHLDRPHLLCGRPFPSLAATCRHCRPGCCRGGSWPFSGGSRLSHWRGILPAGLVALSSTQSSGTLLKLPPSGLFMGPSSRVGVVASSGASIAA